MTHREDMEHSDGIMGMIHGDKGRQEFRKGWNVNQNHVQEVGPVRDYVRGKEKKDSPKCLRPGSSLPFFSQCVTSECLQRQHLLSTEQ